MVGKLKIIFSEENYDVFHWENLSHPLFQFPGGARRWKLRGWWKKWAYYSEENSPWRARQDSLEELSRLYLEWPRRWWGWTGWCQILMNWSALEVLRGSLNEFGFFPLDRGQGDLLRWRREPNGDIHCLKGFHVVLRLVWPHVGNSWQGVHANRKSDASHNPTEGNLSETRAVPSLSVLGSTYF